MKKQLQRAMVRAMCGQKVVDKKTNEEQMDMLGLKETIDRLATANRVRGYGHELRRDDNSVLRVALDPKVARESEVDRRRPGRSKWKRKQRRLVQRRRMAGIEQSGETKCE